PRDPASLHNHLHPTPSYQDGIIRPGFWANTYSTSASETGKRRSHSSSIQPFLGTVVGHANSDPGDYNGLSITYHSTCTQTGCNCHNYAADRCETSEEDEGYAQTRGPQTTHPTPLTCVPTYSETPHSRPTAHQAKATH
ncbi:Hypothetical predicted protein, partial [Pelobates cultripes]